MLNIDRIQVGTTTYYIMDTVARSSLSTKVDATDIYTTTQINNFLEAKANSADLGDLALLDTISYTSDLLTNKPTLGTMASKDDAASDNKQYVRKNGAWSEVSIPTLEWGQISGTLSNQTDLANALSTKANTADLGSLANKNSVDYSSNEVINKPTLGSLASKNSVSYSTEVTDKPTLGTLSSKDKVDWDTDIEDIPSTFPPSSHNHDDRYYTETEIDTFLTTKADKVNLGNLAFKDSVNYSTEITNKPTLGTLSSKDDVSSDNKLYGRKNGTWSEIPPSSAPTWGTISGDLNNQTDLQEALSTKANIIDLGDLASKDTVSWTTDIIDIPDSFPPSTHTHSYNDLTDKPTLGSLADQDTVDYITEVTNKPTLGNLASKDVINYTTDIINTPTLGSLASKDKVNWSTDINNIPANFPPENHTHDDRYYTETEIDVFLSTKVNNTDLGDLANKNTVSWTTDITGIPSTFPPSTHTHSYTTLTDKPTLGSLADQDTVNWETEVTNKPTLGSLAALNSISYTSSYLTNKPTLGDLASLNSIDYTSDKLTNKPTLGSLAAKDTVSWSTEITDIPSSFPPSSHTHDDRYYTESEVDTALSTKAPLASPAFTGTPTAPTATDGTNNTQIATTQFVHNAFKANDAMVFKGTIGSSGATVTSLPATHYKGWTYKVITAGTYAGQTCEIGDMIICVTDGTSATDSHWTIVQSNVDGAVTGPANATDAHVATFNGTSGKVIQDSGFTIGKSVPSNAVFTDTTYTNGNGITLSGTTFAADFPSSGTPAALGTASNGSANTVARSDHVHAKPSYGNINTSGAITSDTAVGNGDKIVVTDSSNSSKLIRTEIEFDGSTTTKALTPKGTWETFNNYSLPEASADTLGGIKVGTNLSIENGVLSATDTTYSQGAGISIDGTTINNSGVRNIATGSSNGTIKVNINGTSSDVAVKGLGSAAYSATTDFATTSHTHENSTTTTAGFMSAADKQKFNSIENNANNYSLPTASSSVLGGIKVGTNLSISDGVLSATDTTYNNATSTTAGLMSSSDKSKLDDVESGANNYTLPIASSTTLGGIKIGSNLNIDNNGVLSSDNNAAVWGAISGTLSLQTDLQNALNAKSATTHMHGYIGSNGRILGGSPIKNGDYILISQSSSNKTIIYGSSAQFDGSTTTKALSQKGTFEEFNNYVHPTGDGNLHIPANGTTNNGKYLKATETAGVYEWDFPENTTYNEATSTSSGLISFTDKNKLDGIEIGANAYILPIATSSNLGGIKIGDNLNIDENGVVSAIDTTYSAATSTNIGLINDAPSDGNQYARIDGEWQLSESSGNSIILNDDTAIITGPISETTTQYIYDIIGESFSPNIDYAINDLVIYDNGLYKFISAHSAGDWDSSSVTTAIISNEINNIKNNYLPLTGGILTGNLTYQSSIVNAFTTDNGVTTLIYPTTFNFIDTNGKILTRLESDIYPNGDIGSYWYVRNYNTSGTQVGAGGIMMTMDKTGELTWNISNSTGFCSAINAVNKAGDTMTGTLVLHTTGLETPETEGFTTDKWGNLVHKGTSNTSTWNIKNNQSVRKFAVEYETAKIYTYNTIRYAPSDGVSYINGCAGNGAGLYVIKPAINASHYIPAITFQTYSGGAWSIGNYNDETINFVYGSKANIDSGTNSTSRVFIDTAGNYSGNAANVTGTVAITNGGTGATYAANARKNLGYLGMFFSPSWDSIECTVISNNSNLNTATFTECKKFSSGNDSSVSTLTNCPASNAFQMLVVNLLGTNTSALGSATWDYRTRIILTYRGDIYVQGVNTNSSKTIIYGSWRQITMS